MIKTTVPSRHLILGGARSGKSAYAEAQATQAAQASSRPLVYLATASAQDNEMRLRIERHQQDRHQDWLLIEEPLKLATSLQALAEPSVVLIDCLTLWLSNCLHSTADAWPHEKQALLAILESSPHQLIMVSNEVGQGIVPLGELTRNYVDEIGWLHQALAHLCQRVTMVIAGLPQPLK